MQYRRHLSQVFSGIALSDDALVIVARAAVPGKSLLQQLEVPDLMQEQRVL
jgi:hypothetical protein